MTVTDICKNKLARFFECFGKNTNNRVYVENGDTPLSLELLSESERLKRQFLKYSK